MATFQKVKPLYQKKTLGEVIDFIDGDRGSNYPSEGEFFSSGACLFLNTKNVPSSKFSFEEKMFIDAKKDAVLRKGKLQRGDYVLTTRGTVGNFAYYDKSVPYENVRINSGMVILRKKTNELDEKFFRYYLSSASFSGQVKSRITGSAQPQLPIRDMLSMEIALPDLPAQTRIASVLSAYDDLIENNEKRIKALEEMAQLLYTEWFIKFEFPGHEKVKMVDSGTEYGLVPEGWKVKRLGDVVGVQYGYTASAEENNDYPKYLRGTDINKKSFIDWQGVPNCKISEDDFKKYKIKKGDVFIIRMADPGKIGICEREIKAVFASYLMRLNIKSNLTPYYLYYFVTSERYQGFVLGASGGTTRKSVNSQQVGAIDILIPKREILDNFEAKAGLLREELTKLIQQNNSLSKTRDLLIPQLVVGRRELK